jgi:DNA-binding transcriptional LysR family regulator
VQDFADTLLTGLLATFSALNPDAQIYARVAGTVELQNLLERRQLDVIVGFTSPSDPKGTAVSEMRWYGDADVARRDILPLAVIETPCRFREAAIRALESAERPYRIAVETPNLSTLKAAVQAGLAVTSRTHLFLRDMDPLDSNYLPPLPNIACLVDAAEDIDLPARRLAELTRSAVRDLGH